MLGFIVTKEVSMASTQPPGIQLKLTGTAECQKPSFDEKDQAGSVPGIIPRKRMVVL
jgi:hypothetical protein